MKITRERGFITNQTDKLFKKICSNLSNININYYLKLQKPIMHRQFFKFISENPDCVQTHCIDRKNSFHFACRK